MAEKKVLSERYELETKIGSGGMGTVWRARDRLLDRDVAVKLLHESFTSDPTFSERFRREARAAASLQHPNIVAVYDTGEEDGVPFIVMELVEGDSLHAALHNGPLPIDATTRVARSTLDALAHAHERGLVHRDMKPANILIESRTGDVKVADFGIAKGIEETTGGLTRTGTLIGTASYISPEQATGGEATAGSDLYAVGCMLYACLAGEPPFSGDSPVAVAMQHLRDPVPPLRARRPEVPRALEGVVMRALEKDPVKRFRSAEEMRRAIDDPRVVPAATAGATSVSTRPMTVPPEPVARPPATERLAVDRARRSPRAGRALAAVTAVLIAAAAVWLTLTYLNGRPNPNDGGTLPSGPPTGAPAITSSPSPSLSPSPTATVQPSVSPSGPGLQLPGIDFGDDD